MDDELMPEGLLGRVLAEAKAIQATVLDDTPVWFCAQNIADACGLPVETATQALSRLERRGEVARSITVTDRDRVTRIYALAEAVENSNQRPEAG